MHIANIIDQIPLFRTPDGLCLKQSRSWTLSPLQQTAYPGVSLVDFAEAAQPFHDAIIIPFDGLPENEHSNVSPSRL